MRVGSPRPVCLAAALALLVAAPAALAQQSAGAKLKNPVNPDAKSIATGKKLFGQHCASCHGASGRGDGPEGKELKPAPANFTDSDWKHGSTDGDIYTVIRNGVPNTDMKAFGGRMPPQEIWHLVNYLRTLAPKSSPSH